MTDEFHKPTMFAPRMFEGYLGAEDPARLSRMAHDTASALLARVRADPDPEVVERLVAYTDQNGVDAVAELWSHASPRSLPGTLWRLYLVRLLIHQDPVGVSYRFQRGVNASPTIDPVIAGAADPAGPAEVVAVADEILRGVFTGDLAVALDRAAAFSRLSAVGCASLADDADLTEPDRASELTTRASRFAELASDFATSARLWRSDSLD